MHRGLPDGRLSRVLVGAARSGKTLGQGVALYQSGWGSERTRGTRTGLERLSWSDGLDAPGTGEGLFVHASPGNPTFGRPRPPY
ncbi:hypothetical protein NDU88_000540 [Pleurodeles waltl]|uniref:Uncharacterized protein n=1 Tax=Pleurodeles waltl TaxID=8319 RepID=A0AAV7TFB4_PLEWA|nr:hypothetical protein NDU88_000540 [Pleurodeles waltl]